MLVLFKLELCINFFTPLICVISCCFFFFSLSFWVGEGISTSFCLSVTNNGEMSQHGPQCEHPSRHPPNELVALLTKRLCTPVQTQVLLLGAFSNFRTELNQNRNKKGHKTKTKTCWGTRTGLLPLQAVPSRSAWGSSSCPAAPGSACGHISTNFCYVFSGK